MDTNNYQTVILKLKRPLFITGMPGSGKTTIGKLVAYDLSVPFYDLDKIIEAKEKRTIASIFAENGEEYFRQIENSILLNFLEEKKDEIYVLALGGGTVCFFDSINKLKKVGLLIYLETEIDQLLNQLSNQNTNRPILTSKDGIDLKTKLENILEERKNFYSKANFIIQSNPDKRITMADVVEIVGR